MSKYDPDNHGQDISEMDINNMSPELEAELVADIRREEREAARRDAEHNRLAGMSEWQRRREMCTHDYDCCPCFPEDEF